MFFPAIPTAPVVLDQAQMELEMTRLAFALAEYRADHGSNPTTLAELLPDYVKSLPDDIFVDAPLQYEATDDGYVLRSVGPDPTHDTSAKDYEAADHDEWNAGITVRMPGRGSTP